MSDEPVHWFELELSGNQLRILFSYLRLPKPHGVSDIDLQLLTEALRSGIRHEGHKLVKGTLNWDELEAQAEAQGCSLADLFFDGFRSKA